MNKKALLKFNNRFNSFVLAFEQLKKDQHRNSIDKSITINEVHLIDLIGRNQPVNLVKLSEILEVSRSAVTQSVRRLTKKELIVFEFAPDNEKNKYLRLSEKGVGVFNIHKEQQEHIEKAIFSVLRNYGEENLQMVMGLMDDVEKVWQELPW
ncbi:MarR family transcriptional regulator [uncultured Streptococcus sp.]|uniref:MarR family winged helix-turn-helix transcriptional regulator n=1 Tax=uncultured Streptococcus sp. TaxID=83427 RepID=UPI0032119CB5